MPQTITASPHPRRVDADSSEMLTECAKNGGFAVQNYDSQHKNAILLGIAD